MCRLYNVFANIKHSKQLFGTLIQILHSTKSYQYKGAVGQQQHTYENIRTRNKLSARVINFAGAEKVSPNKEGLDPL